MRDLMHSDSLSMFGVFRHWASAKLFEVTTAPPMNLDHVYPFRATQRGREGEWTTRLEKKWRSKRVEHKCFPTDGAMNCRALFTKVASVGRVKRLGSQVLFFCCE